MPEENNPQKPKSDLLKQAMQEPAPKIPTPAAPAQPGQPTPQKPATPAKSSPGGKKPKSNRLLIGCLSAIGGTVLLMFIVLIIFFTSTSLEENPILQLFGIEAGNLKGLLINLTHLVFMLLVFVTFLTTLIGLFRFSLAKKDNKVARGKGLKMTLISLFLFIIFI